MRPALLPPRIAALCLILALAACVDPATRLAGADLAAQALDCGAPGAATCAFANAPLQLEAKEITLAGRPYPFRPLARPLDFTDGAGRNWTAPRATLTDGASIPLLFVPVVGSPRTREFALAAALHDAYCGIGNEDGATYHAARWQEAHRMFYDTLIAGGTPEVKAKVMFAAVWLGGPRWSPSGHPDTRLERLPKALRIAQMQRVKAYVEATNPPLPVLLPYLERVEREMFRAVALPEGQDPNSDGAGGGRGNFGGGSGAVRPG